MSARVLGFLALVFVTAAAFATPASAETRTAGIFDAQDATPTISGAPNNPDIKYVGLTYDSNGSIRIRVEFFNALNALELSQNYSFIGNFTVGKPDSDGVCSATATGGVTGQHHVFSNTSSFYDRAYIAGFDGYLDFTRTVGADQKSIDLVGSSAVIANRDFRCLKYSLITRRVSTASAPDSDYDAGCDCWYELITLDGLTSKNESFIWFDGFSPNSGPTGKKVASKMRFSPVAGCRNIDLSGWEVTPDEINGVERPYGSRMVFDVRRGKIHKQKRVKVVGGGFASWRLSPGRYRMRAWYPGDKYRRKSNVVVRHVRVKRC